jgi:hypothetical protein
VKINPRRLAVTALGITATVAGLSALTSAVPAVAADTDAPPSIVETFEYPGGSNLPGITLVSGDGHILLVGCDEGRTSAEVWKFNVDLPYCFEFKGKTGYVSLKLDDVYGIRNNNDFAVNAKVSVAGVEETVAVPADDWQGVGVGAGKGPAVLLELRSS